MTTPHTLTPWHVSGKTEYGEFAIVGSPTPNSKFIVCTVGPVMGSGITEDENKTNAEFIVRAVNAYDELMGVVHAIHDACRGGEWKDAINKAESILATVQS